MATGLHCFAFHHIFGTALCILSFSRVGTISAGMSGVGKTNGHSKLK